MADHFGRAAARNYAAGKAAGLSSREIAQIPAGEFPVQIRPWKMIASIIQMA